MLPRNQPLLALTQREGRESKLAGHLQVSPSRVCSCSLASPHILGLGFFGLCLWLAQSSQICLTGDGVKAGAGQLTSRFYDSASVFSEMAQGSIGGVFVTTTGSTSNGTRLSAR